MHTTENVFQPGRVDKDEKEAVGSAASPRRAHNEMLEKCRKTWYN